MRLGFIMAVVLFGLTMLVVALVEFMCPKSPCEEEGGGPRVLWSSLVLWASWIGFWLFAVPLGIVMANCRPAVQQYEEAESAPSCDEQAGLCSCPSRVKRHRDIQGCLTVMLVTNPAISAVCMLVRPMT
jgi:hypothetical protein